MISVLLSVLLLFSCAYAAEWIGGEGWRDAGNRLISPGFLCLDRDEHH